ncbi:hypothetical protein [Novosphingopyxis baekryungensis]|uniref:hypothetical protein n=1 Tax=Novosphingopyxis baekryungensis TaxID=279369 RepID=UPI0012EB6B98|nr:hypothetical protein [Novosphingopyxis baekryungensis]
MATALQRKYKAWLGEKEGIEKDVARIVAAYQTLDEKRARIDRVTMLLDSVETIMSEILPDWDPLKQKGVKSHTYRHAFPIGEITRLTTKMLREASEPIPIRKILDYVIELKKIDREDRDLMDATYKAIDGNLRSMRRRGHIKSTDDFVALWYISDEIDEEAQ